jgi:hypothetical protein
MSMHGDWAVPIRGVVLPKTRCTGMQNVETMQKKKVQGREGNEKKEGKEREKKKKTPCGRRRGSLSRQQAPKEG